VSAARGAVADPFIGSRLKVERAREHLDALYADIQEWSTSEPFRYVSEDDPVTGHSIIRVRTAGQGLRPPDRLALLAGDAIHNLRAALDHLVVELAELGSGADQQTQFPIYDDSEKYDLAEERLIGRLRREHRTRIASLQPFHVRGLAGPGIPLLHPDDSRAVNVSIMLVGRLDNVDKHNLLLPTTAVMPFQQPEFDGVSFAEGTYPTDWIRLYEGAEVFRVTAYKLKPGAQTVTLKKPLPFTIWFGDPEFDLETLWADRSKGTASRADLLQAADHIDRVIDSFDDLTQAGDTGP
jgi:hypothetical protein